MQKSNLDELYIAVVNFLESSKIPYLIIGGLAVSIIGEPRMTQDIDLIVSIKKRDINHILQQAKNSGFELDINKELLRVKNTGTFRLNKGSFHADFIIASTTFEESAFARSQQIKLAGKKVFFPSPEDLILFKIIVGREKDMLDARSIVLRHKKHLNIEYLKKWTQSISDEAEDMNVWNRLMKILGE